MRITAPLAVTLGLLLAGCGTETAEVPLPMTTPVAPQQHCADALASADALIQNLQDSINVMADAMDGASTGNIYAIDEALPKLDPLQLRIMDNSTAYQASRAKCLGNP